MSAHASTPYQTCSDASARPIGWLNTLGRWSAQLGQWARTTAPATRPNRVDHRPRNTLRRPVRAPEALGELDPQIARDIGLGDDMVHHRQMHRMAERLRDGLPR